MNSSFDQGYALLIGIQYKHWIRGHLACTLNDVNAVEAILTHPSKAAYPGAQVLKLTEEKATAQQIIDTLDRLEKSVKPDSTVIIYYSGHGGSQDGRYFFVPYDFNIAKFGDGSPDWDNSTLVFAETFQAKVKAIQKKTRKVLVILDCCHAGGISPLKSSNFEKSFLEAFSEGLYAVDSEEKSLNPGMLSTGEGIVILSSSKPEETSLAGNPYSLFTQALKEVMEGQSKTANDDGWVYIEDIKRYLDTHVPVRANPHPQNPVTDMRSVSGLFRVCAYDIAKAKGEISSNNPSPLQINDSKEIETQALFLLIDTDMIEAFKALDKLKWGNKLGTYLDKKGEWADPPNNFNKTMFRGQLKTLVNLLLG